MAGPLTGVRVLEIASAAPGPFACMVLGDLGAEVLRVDRLDAVGRTDRQALDPLVRSRRSVAVDLKAPAGQDVVRRLVASSDVLVEGFRPGVMERLGLGPDDLLGLNPRLVYGRMTGWGQSGPMSQRAGHDINYTAMAGALDPIGREGERPFSPLNLVGDFGGGGMLLAVGVLSALLERATSGRGQVVDAAIVDGSALLMAHLMGMRAQGVWREERGTNLLDGGAPFYDTYLTSDGGYMSVGALERRFYAQLLQGLGLADEDLPGQMDRDGWPRLRARLAQVFLTRTRAEWTEVFVGLDACVAPVLTCDEAAADGHVGPRGVYVEVGGLRQPAPAPRFSRTAADLPTPAPVPGEHTRQALLDWGFEAAEVAGLERSGAIGATADAVPLEVSA